MNKSRSLDLEFSENLATTQIIALGNLIGDILWLLEVEMLKKTGSNPYVQRINMLIDHYAKQFDELLVKQETGLLEDMEKLFKLLLSDLERIRTDSLKFYKNTIKDTL